MNRQAGSVNDRSAELRAERDAAGPALEWVHVTRRSRKCRLFGTRFILKALEARAEVHEQSLAYRARKSLRH
jgi:hypothetical protein